MNFFTKTLAAGAAALTLALAFAPAAEARGRHGGHGFHGHHGHHGLHGHRWGGHRFHGHRRWAGVGVIGVGYGGCYIARKRVYDDYTGRVLVVRRTVCG